MAYRRGGVAPVATIGKDRIGGMLAYSAQQALASGHHACPRQQCHVYVAWCCYSGIAATLPAAYRLHYLAHICRLYALYFHRGCAPNMRVAGGHLSACVSTGIFARHRCYSFTNNKHMTSGKLAARSDVSSASACIMIPLPATITRNAAIPGNACHCPPHRSPAVCGSRRFAFSFFNISAGCSPPLLPHPD